eukprot:g14787.t1
MWRRPPTTTARALGPSSLLCMAVVVLVVADSPASAATAATGILALFVRANSGNRSDTIGGRDADGWEGGAAAGACGSSEEDACPDIRSALGAIPKPLPEGSWPQLRLLPGLYTGDGNVFIGGPGDADYPPAARNVSLVGGGWRGSAKGGGDEDGAGAVLSCEGRQSRNVSSSPATRGVWLSEGRITSLANLTVTDCPAGGVGVDVWPQRENDPFSSPSLVSVALVGNGGDGDERGDEPGCEKGGGLLVTATTTTKKPIAPLEAGAGAEEGVAAAAGAPLLKIGEQGQGHGQEEGHGPAVPALALSLSGCIVRNNTARLGGGIAIDPAASPSWAARFLPGSLEAAGMVEKGPTSEGGGAAVLSVVLSGATEVSENLATSGGGLWASGAAVALVGGKVVVRGNVAGVLEGSCGEEKSCGGRGGGVHVNGGTLSLDGVSFDQNRAETHQARDEYAKGGGLAARGCLVSATGCSFSGNGAAAMAAASAGIGGGMFLDDSNATLSDCRFEGNAAEGSDLFGQLASFGGGLATRGPSHLTTISGSSFVANAAGMGGSGGGIWVEDGAKAVLTGTELINNTAASSYTHKGAGGGVAVAASAHLSMADGCILEGNVAGPEDVEASEPACLSGEGGAVYSSGSGISLTGVALRRNRCETGGLDAGCSGGAVSVTGRGPSLSPAAAGDGGAAFERCLFEGNGAKGATTRSVYSGAGQGGAVAIRFAFPTFTACNFTGNSAEGGGGPAPATGGALLLFLSRGDGYGNGGGGGGGGKKAEAHADANANANADADADAGAEKGVGNSHPKFVNCTFSSNRAGGSADEDSTAVPDEPHGGQEVHAEVSGRGSLERRRRRQGHGMGGAIAAISSSPVLIGCSFWNNTAVAELPTSSGGGGGGGTPVSGGSPSFGGAIVLTSDCSGTTLDDCTLDGNMAVNGVGGDLAVLAAPSGGGSTAAAAVAAASAAAAASPTAGAASPSSSSSSPPGDATAVLSGCRFRPGAPQSDPAVPWADGKSETSASPFVFLLDGGTVELISPVFESAGQAFVAQVDPPELSANGEGGGAHLRIVDGDASRFLGAGFPSSSGDGHELGSSDRARGGKPTPMLSIVSVGGRVSLLGGSGSASEAPAVPFHVQDLVLLRSELSLDGGDEGRRGATVEGSARLRMANVSSVTGGAHVHVTAGVVDDGGGGGVATGGEVALRTVGETRLGDAWEPKPFFLGTSLSQGGMAGESRLGLGEITAAAAI